MKWKDVFDWIKLIAVFTLIIVFFYMSLFVPKKTICVDTFNMTNISIEDADLKEAGDFLHKCVYDCSNYLSNGYDRLECIKLCFSKVQVK